MAAADRILTLHRDEHSDEVLARGGDSEAHSILQRTGFVHVVRRHEQYHRLPINLAPADEAALALRAVARLRAVGYHVDRDDAFDTDLREPHYLPLGGRIAHIADRIREATGTEEVAEALTELTASHDGILAAVGEVLMATADFCKDLEDSADPQVRLRVLAAERLDILADRLQFVSDDFQHLRNDLADRHQPHPHRITCRGEVPPEEPERSAL